METQFFKRGLFAKVIIYIIIANFIFGSAPVNAYAAWDKIRPVAAKGDGRLDEVKQGLTAITRAEDIPLFEAIPGVSLSLSQEELLRSILGDYKFSQTVDDLPFGNYIKRALEPSVSKDKLEQVFGAQLQSGEEYYVLFFADSPIALVKKDGQGKLSARKIAKDLAKVPLAAILEEPALSAAQQKGLGAIDVLLNDYLFLEERAKKPMANRMTLDYREMREYAAQHKKNTPGFEVDPLFLTGGKGLSLSLVDGLPDVSVPPGFNVTTTAYFKFVRENPEIFEIINRELRALDTTDDQKRDVITREIREVISNAHIPEEIKQEILVMYRQLNIIRALSGKKTPTAIAVRSSGIKEDINLQSWIPASTGSQAGQSDTYLNVKGEKNVLEKTKADFASLFTDRGVSYRDDGIFLIFSTRMGFQDKQPQQVYYDLLAKLREYSTKLGHPEFNAYADTLTNFRNPGSVNLINAMEEILKREDHPEIRHCLEAMRKTAEEFVHPDQIGIDVVEMQMVKSYASGVIFTVKPDTRMAGVPQALWGWWYKGDDSLVYRNEEGRVIGTKPIVVSFDISYGYGENVVGGKVNPDKFNMGTYDGVHWFPLEKYKGNKLIQMIDVEEAIDLLKDKISEEAIRNLAAMLGKAISYDEVGKRVNGILATRLYGTRYLKELPDGRVESDRDKKARAQRIAEELAGMIKARSTTSEAKEFIKQHFYVTNISGAFGLKEEVLDGLINEVISSVERARAESEEGKRALSSYFGSPERADNFIMMFKEVLENKEFSLAHREEVLDKLKLTAKESRNLSYLMRSLIDKSFTCNLETTQRHRDSFSITDAEAESIARMAWSITTYYKDQRDIEFAIEIDPSTPEDKRLNLYALDMQGNVLTMAANGELVKTDKEPEELGQKGRVALRLYNVQARPYTAEYAKVNFIQQRTEVDESFIEERGIKPIAVGTKGENATHAYVLAFDPNKTIDWHTSEIYRLKVGWFTKEEREQIRRLGFNLDDYGPASDKHLPIALYLLEADPSHDPIMRLVDAVITIRGGDTCHAAIFCREQRIPAVTGAGKIILDGHLLKTGDGLTVDANNGRVFKQLLPINYVERMIKPHGIPGNKLPDGRVVDDDGFPIPTVGEVLAAAKSSQENTPMMLAVDAGGKALTRAEFKAEEMGINVFEGYGYQLIQDIKAGKMDKPTRIYIQGLVAGRVKGQDKFVAQLNRDIEQHFTRNQKLRDEFNSVFGREYNRDDGLALLTAFDILRDINAGGLDKRKFVPTLEQYRALTFISRIPQGSLDFLNYVYGVTQRRFNFDFNIIEALDVHPWVIEETSAKLREKGYRTFKDYAGKEFYFFYNLMGFTSSPDQKAKNRAYDFAQDKVEGLIGSEIFSWPGVNPLVGLRGSSLEIEGVDDEFDGNQRVLSFLLEAVIDADENTHNQSWFYVFVRSTRELEILDTVLGRIAARKGKLPKQIGIMIEVPSDAMLAGELARRMLKIREKYAKYGVESVFFSFGTNDYSYLAGKSDREDPRIKLVIADPAALRAIAEMRQEGYFYDTATKKLPLVDEGAEVMRQLMEAVVAAANEEGVETSLCGEAITSLVQRGDLEAAGKMMSLLKSFGISMMSARLLASMARFDTMAAMKQIVVPEAQREALFDLKDEGEVLQKKGVVKGEAVFVDSAEDLIANTLKGLKGKELKERREFLEMQGLESARSTMRTFNRIVVVTRNLIAMPEAEYLQAMTLEQFQSFINEKLIRDIGNGLYIWTNLTSTEKKFEDELAKKGYAGEVVQNIIANWRKAYDNTAAGLKRRYIDWNDLEYALAIIVDGSVNLEGWDVFTRDKGIVPTRIKAKANDIGKLRQELEGQFITLDYAAGKIYKGNLEVRKEEFKPRHLPIPELESQVETRGAVREDANDVYNRLKYHPLFLLAYAREQSGGQQIEDSVAKIFDEYVEGLADELDKISEEENPDKRRYLFGEFKARIAREPEEIIRNFLQDLIEKVEQGKEVVLTRDWLVNLRDMYFARNREVIGNVRRGIAGLLKGESVREFIKEAFKQNMRDALAKNKGKFVVHTTTSLNPLYLRNMLGGFLVEQVNRNPDHGLLGAARALGDFSEINRMELEAFKEVWQALPAEERRNFGLQITELKGTQSGAVIIGWRHILEEMGIIPGDNGLEVGVNIATPTDTLALDKYFAHFRKLGSGLSFVTYDRMLLGAAWAGVDIYWSEWRRLAREEELQARGDTAIRIIKGKIEEANKIKSDGQATKGVVVFAGEETGVRMPQGLSSLPAPVVGIDGVGPNKALLERVLAELKPVAGESTTPREDIRFSDADVYSYFSPGFDKVIDSVKGVENESGALVIGANAIFKNAGAIGALRKIKEAGTGLKVAVWAQNEEEVAKLKAMGVGEVVDIMATGVAEALSKLEQEAGVPQERIALINSVSDLEGINLPQLQESRLGLSIIEIESPIRGQPKLNSMPLVFARAIAGIFKVETVTTSYRELVQNYQEEGRQISSEDLAVVTDLSTQISTMPLVAVTQDIAAAQLAYEEAQAKF